MTLSEKFSDDPRFEGLIFYDEFDEAFMGLAYQFNRVAVIYDSAKCIEILKRDMSEEEAWEHFEFNTMGGYLGDSTPMFFTGIAPL